MRAPGDAGIAGSRRVAVVGGGVAGLSAALHLRLGGAEVVVLERHRTGAGASSGNAGWICPTQAGPLPEPGLATYGLRALLDRDSPLYVDPRHLPRLAPWLVRFARNCAPARHRRGVVALEALGRRAFGAVADLEPLGFRPELHRLGLLVASRDPAVTQAFLDGLEAFRARDATIPTVPLTGEAVRELEPALSSAVRAAAVIRRHWHVRPDSYMSSLAAVATAHGVQITEDAPVLRFATRGGAVTHVETPGGDVEADAVVLATGARLGTDTRMLGVALPVEAGKGYSFSVALDPVPSHAVLFAEPHVGCSPLTTGVRLAGTMEFSGVNDRLVPGRIEAMQRGVRPLLSSWDEGSVAGEWTGMRPIAPDGLPIVGRLPGSANVYVSGAYSMLGMTLALPAAEALAELVLTGRRPEVLAPFDAARFARRAASAARARAAS
ncbi:FAD-dependent oxidoreductase [Baekduia soli]|uniref:FAD-dependent oxidoreductase n=1 Tax=Baekduia soli TaxID=496014 RepID=A0A5B8U5M0_9ACTN|nr:FAD-dependent oxidoreductase [Baekduia soli]QEC48320.1 FAD-dependent oxidoreductase [Baekduia soli]